MKTIEGSKIETIAVASFHRFKLKGRNPEDIFCTGVQWMIEQLLRGTITMKDLIEFVEPGDADEL